MRHGAMYHGLVGVQLGNHRADEVLGQAHGLLVAVGVGMGDH